MDFQSPIVSKKNFEKSSNMKKYKGNIAIFLQNILSHKNPTAR